MGTRFSRIAILVIFAVGGAALIQTGFSVGGVSAGILPSPSPVGIPGGGSSDGGSGGGSDAQESPSSVPTTSVISIADFQGLRVAVYNGTSMAGLAADTSAAFQTEYGMIAAITENADIPFPVTEIKYAEGYEEYAWVLIRAYFGPLVEAVQVSPLNAVITDRDQIVLQITLGADWAAEQ